MNRNDVENLREFFKNTFDALEPDEYIALIAMRDGEVIRQSFVKTIEKIINFSIIYEDSYDLFFGVATTDSTGRETENLISASVIALDFDFGGHAIPNSEEFTTAIRNVLKVQIGQLVNSGHGYHIYIPIEKTRDITIWNELTCKLCKMLGADENAALSTQIMRIPFTINYKETDNPKRVRLVYSNRKHCATLHKISRIISVYENSNNKNPNSTRTKYCIEMMLKGVDEGERNVSLGRIVSYLKARNLSSGEIEERVNNWNALNNPPLKEGELKNMLKGYIKKDYNMNGCLMNNPEKCLQLENYCNPILCEYHRNIRRNKTDSYENQIEIPKKLTDKSVLDALTGNELALLLFVYFNGDKTNKSSLCQIFSRSSINKYIASLIKKGFLLELGREIKLNKGLMFSQKMPVSVDIENRILTCELKGNNLKAYLYILHLNYYNQHPTSKDLSSALEIDYSNTCKCVNSLIEMDLIDNNYIPNGAGWINQLAA